MPLSLTITDAADGTGGTATIVGSDAGGSVTLHAAAFDGAMGTPAWSAAGTRTGDGVIAVAPGNGFYLWYAAGVVGGSPALSNVAYQNLSDAGLLSVHERCLAATQTALRTLALVPPGQVQVRQRPLFFSDDETYPIVLVTPAGKEGQAGVLTGKDDILYPVEVGVIDRKSQPVAYEATLSRDLLWRQRIFRAFRNQRLPGVPEVVNATVTPDWVLDPAALSQTLLWKSGFLINFTSREVRGLS